MREDEESGFEQTRPSKAQYSITMSIDVSPGRNVAEQAQFVAPGGGTSECSIRTLHRHTITR